MPKNLNLSGVKPNRPMTEEEVSKAYIESMIMLPALLQAVMQQLVVLADSMSIIGLYYEKKGLAEVLFTEKDLEADGEDDDEPAGPSL